MPLDATYFPSAAEDLEDLVVLFYPGGGPRRRSQDRANFYADLATSHQQMRFTCARGETKWFFDEMGWFLNFVLAPETDLEITYAVAAGKAILKQAGLVLQPGTRLSLQEIEHEFRRRVGRRASSTRLANFLIEFWH